MYMYMYMYMYSVCNIYLWSDSLVDYLIQISIDILLFWHVYDSMKYGK